MPNQNNTNREPIFPAPRLPRDLPPFWELEQLLSAGNDLETALLELSRRREALSSGRSLPPTTEQVQPAGLPSGIFTIAS